MKNWVDLEGGRKLELDGDRVDPVSDLHLTISLGLVSRG